MNNIFKKGLFYAFMAAGLLLAFSACQKEETMPATEGCSFTAVIPGGAPQTKAVNDDFGQGGSVNRCILEIYYKNELYKRIEKGVAGKQITFDNLNLIPSQEYDFVFWADCATEKRRAVRQRSKTSSTRLQIPAACRILQRMLPLQATPMRETPFSIAKQ